MFDLTVRGLRELDWKLRMLVARLRSDLPETMRAIATVAAKRAQGKIGHYQTDWPRLADSTVREKGRLGYAPPDNPLLRTGAMRSSIRAEGDAMVATVRADAPAKWQERGTRDGHIPARPFLKPALEEAAPEAKRMLGEVFETAIRES